MIATIILKQFFNSFSKKELVNLFKFGSFWENNLDTVFGILFASLVAHHNIKVIAQAYGIENLNIGWTTETITPW